MSTVKTMNRRRFEVPEFRIERSDGSPSVISGHAAVFNSKTDLGWFTEEIAPGAFRDSLQRGDDVRALFNHDCNLILGRTKADTLALSEDERGLFAKITLPDTQLGRDLAVSIERRDISQMSFGFFIDEEEIQQNRGGKPHSIIKRATLFDVSPVTFPAYESTDIDVQRATRARFDCIQAALKAEKEKRDRELELLLITA